MKTLGTDFKTIYQHERFMLALMILNFLISGTLLIFGIVNLNPSSAVVRIGYGDIGGYRSGSWTDMLAFPLLALVFGILHNFIAISIFKKRGAGMAKFFLLTTTMLIVGTAVTLLRLLGTI
jgi:hypothetical protein